MCHLSWQRRTEITGGQRLLRKGRRANTEARETGMRICLFKTVFTARAVSFFICFCLALLSFAFLCSFSELKTCQVILMMGCLAYVTHYLSHFLWWLISLIMMSDYASDDNDLKVFVSFFTLQQFIFFEGKFVAVAHNNTDTSFTRRVKSAT